MPVPFEVNINKSRQRDVCFTKIIRLSQFDKAGSVVIFCYLLSVIILIGADDKVLSNLHSILQSIFSWSRTRKIMDEQKDY